MFLKDHLKKTYKQAYLDNDNFVKESIVIKWVHRFGIDSLNDLFLQIPVLKEEEKEEVNEEHINSESLKTLENKEENSLKKSDEEKIPRNKVIINKQKKAEKNYIEYIDDKRLPLPYIKNLRKWIDKDRKAS